MGATLDFAEEPLHHIVGPNGLPMLLRKRIEGQTSLQIALQALDRRWIDLLILFDKGCNGLISRWPILLIEQGTQLRFDLLLLLGGDIAQDVVHLVHHTA